MTTLTKYEQQLREENEALKRLLSRFVTDIDAMRCPPPFDIKESGVPQYQEHWFGGFGETGYDDMAEESLFQWPCIGMLADDARKAVGLPEREQEEDGND